MSIQKVIALCAMLTLAISVTPVKAATDFGQVLQDIGKDAAKGYMSPAVTWFGTSMNSGWYNSSKSLTMFKLPVGISVLSIGVPFVVVGEEMRTFDFSGNLPAKMIMDPLVGNWDSLVAAGPFSAAQQAALKTIPFVAPDCPTMFGADTQKTVTIADFFSRLDPALRVLLLNSPGLGQPAPVDSNRIIKLPFKGLDLEGAVPSIPTATAVTVGIKSIPVIDNIQVGLRYFPTKKIGSFGEIGQFGLKLQHEFTRFIPVVNSLPLIHTSAYWAMNSLNIKAGPASLEQSNWVAMVNASLDFKFLLGLGIFGGLGMESSNLALKVDMSEAGMENFDIEIPGDNGFRMQVGARVSLLCFDVWADANYGAVASYNLGITLIGLNGL